MKEGRKPEYPEKTPGDELQKMPHTTARRFKPQARLEPAQWHWWQVRKAGMLTVTPRVAVVLRLVMAVLRSWRVDRRSITSLLSYAFFFKRTGRASFLRSCVRVLRIVSKGAGSTSRDMVVKWLTKTGEVLEQPFET